LGRPRRPTSTGSLIAAAQSDLARGLDPRQKFAARLDAARHRGGFLALTLKGVELPGVAERLAARFDAVPVSLDELFLTALRELAGEQGVQWQALLKADASFAVSGVIGAGQATYARLASERVTARVTALAEQAGPRAIVFAHQAGLPARYWDAGGRELLVTLQAAARHPPTARTGRGSSSPPSPSGTHRPWRAGRWRSRTGRASWPSWTGGS
jgi:hypothetical protein